MTNSSPNIAEVTLEEIILFGLFNLLLILIGIILFYYVWIKSYGIMIPLPQLSNEDNLTFFNTKNFKIGISELYKRIKSFDKSYLIRSIGPESYIYLIFQRKLISLIITISIFSFLFSFISNFLGKEDTNSTIRDFLINNKYLNDFTTIIHVISVFLFTFLHFRFFTSIKSDAKFIYFDRFDKMSRRKDADWLSCRTLHVSGLGPTERNSKNK
jgi:hypothetical protein